MMNTSKIRKAVTVLGHALVAQALCWAAMAIGMAVTTLENALIIHAIAAPIIAVAVSSIYFRKFNYTTPLQTAIVFLSVVLAIDFFVVALLINKSLEMFTSPIGTWIPISSIFLSTYLTGLYTKKRTETATVA
jgi:hypothetical protein